MKKIIKMFFIIIITIIGIIIIDTVQAIILKNSPLISWKSSLEDNDSWVDKGILIDTYYCTKEKDIVTVNWYFKTSKFTCPIDNFIIVDKTKETDDFTCAEALEEIYEDDKSKYYLSCMKSSYIEVIYSNGKKETIIEGLKSNRINIQDLDTFDIKYYKQNKN